MSGIAAYSQVVGAIVDGTAWDETYFSLLSLKAHLQAVPGYQRFDLWARDLDNGDVKLVVVTNWEQPEQLALWLEKGVTVDAILRAMQPTPSQLTVDLYEEII